MKDQFSMFDLPSWSNTGNATSSPASADGHTHWAESIGPLDEGSGRGLVPANHSQSRESELAPSINGTFGQFGASLSPSVALQSSLESKLQALLEGLGSPMYELTWKRWDMPSGPPICAQRALGRRKSDSDSIGWQTPTTRDGKGESGLGNRMKRAKNGKLHVANLCDQLVDLGRRDLVTSTRFRNWLMGFPESWEAARATATRSSRKSGKRSLKP